MSSNQFREIIVHRDYRFVRHLPVRISDQIGWDVDYSRGQMTGADALEQEIFVRQFARQHLPAGALRCRRRPRGGQLEPCRNVMVVKIDDLPLLCHRRLRHCGI